MTSSSPPTLDDQLQHLTQLEQQEGLPAGTLNPLIPVLRQAATRLQRLQYYIPQNLDHTWLLFTESNRKTGENATVVYAYSTLNDAKSGTRLSAVTRDSVLALPLPLVQIFTRFLAQPTVDRLIFMDTPGDVWNGQVFTRQELVQAIQPQPPIR